ncbi:MAG: hypothetical protein F6K55_32840 [Moorea sp. SIO4A3]|nr:hypothetical protein [Moorena sp. SIO4A3]
MNISRVGILPARKSIETGKMPVLPRCPCHDLLKLARCQFYQHAHAMIY